MPASVVAPSPALRISPLGHLHLDEVEEATALEPGEIVAGAVATRLRTAFAGGDGPGLLHLGAAEVATPLPPGLAWLRELGKRFLAGLCALPDLTALGAQAEVPCPDGELDDLAAAVPPITGAEYVDGVLLRRLWGQLGEAFREAAGAFPGPVEEWLRAQDPAWNLVGRVCFHLAETRDPERPFAFLATYAARLSAQARAQHLPLGRALQEHAGARRKSALLALLAPVDRAAQRSPLIKELVDSGELFHPLAWTPSEAHRFLRQIAACEEAGVVVRVPDWWKARRPPRLQVEVRLGAREPAGLGLDALLDFSVELAVDGEAISEAEWQALCAADRDLALIRGRWVEIDRARLAEVLAHWQHAQRAAREGLSFAQGMRLLSGVGLDDQGGPLTPAVKEWSAVRAGPWLEELLGQLRRPVGGRARREALQAELRPYQRVGADWLELLHRLGLGACLADDMGLGKTLQVLALLTRRRGVGGPSLLVAPASLLGNWQSEIERFAPQLKTLVAHPSALPAEELRTPAPERIAAVDLVMTTYGSIQRLPWLGARRWDTVILDEAQAIKNPSAKQTRAVKGLTARARVALTGTPVENRLGDLWSLFDFLNPGLLGSATQFSQFTRRLSAAGTPDWGPLRELVRPYILRRLKSDKAVIADLPDKTEVRAYCPLSPRQAALYQQAVDALAADLRASDGIRRRGVILASLLRVKQICNHPSQWLGDGGYAPEESGKFVRLRELAEAIAARQEKALVFTQFRELCAPLAALLGAVFRRPGLVLHGGTPIAQRRRLVERFQSDEAVPFFVLSVKAGGTGLNLTAAAHVLHVDRWWNPAVEDQATDRAYRIGQRRNVLVHKFVCRGTVEEKIDALIESKRALSRQILAAGAETLLTEMAAEELLALVALDLPRALAE